MASFFVLLIALPPCPCRRGVRQRPELDFTPRTSVPHALRNREEKTRQRAWLRWYPVTFKRSNNPGLQTVPLLKAVGLDVVSIRRLRIGQVPLGKGPEGAMPPGQWRYLPTGDKF